MVWTIPVQHGYCRESILPTSDLINWFDEPRTLGHSAIRVLYKAEAQRMSNTREFVNLF